MDKNVNQSFWEDPYVIARLRELETHMQLDELEQLRESAWESPAHVESLTSDEAQVVAPGYNAWDDDLAFRHIASTQFAGNQTLEPALQSMPAIEESVNHRQDEWEQELDALTHAFGPDLGVQKVRTSPS